MEEIRCPDCGTLCIVDKQFTPAKKKSKLGVLALTRMKCPNNCGYETTIKTNYEEQERWREENKSLDNLENDKFQKSNAKFLPE